MPVTCLAIVRSLTYRRSIAAIAAVCGAFLLSCPAHADFTIPPGSNTSLNAGGLDLGCTDLIVGGTLQANSAPIRNVRNLVIQGGGLLDAGSSTISVGGNWTNSGTFTAGTSQVNFGDGCGINPAVISGNTIFYNVSFVSSSGKTWQFAPGSTQTVQNLLDIQGDAGNPLQFSSTSPGQGAVIVVYGTRQSTNFNLNNVSFFDPSAAIAAIPTLSPLGMMVLLLLLGVTIAGTSSRRLNQKSTWGI